MGQWILIRIIKGYQRWISPLKGTTCRFYPSCSKYSLEAVQRFGFWKGSALMIRRIVKCHPFHPGGVDLVPESKNQDSEQV